MPLVPDSQSKAIFKREGTSQTYGQLVIFPSKQNSVPVNPIQVVQSPNDIVVTLIANGGAGTLNLSTISDIERSKISLAAFTPSKQVTITLSPNFNFSEAIKETSKQEIVNISSVVENIENFAIVVGGSKGSDELKSTLEEAIKVDLFTTIKSQESEIVEYNNLKDCEIRAEFFYNFYSPNETNIYSQQDQSKDPLLKNSIFNIPRYVKLTWDSKHVTENLKKLYLNSVQFLNL